MTPRVAKEFEGMLRRMEADANHHEEEAARLREAMESLRFALERYGSYDDSANVAGDPSPSIPGQPTGSRVRRETKIARNALYEVLLAAGRPMHARDLLSALNERGIEVTGKDPVNNVRAHLSHDTRFKPVGSGEWALVAQRGVAAPSEPEANDSDIPRDPSVIRPDHLDRWRQSSRVDRLPAHGDQSDEDEDDSSSPGFDDDPSEDELRELDRRFLEESLTAHLADYGPPDDVPF